MAREIGERASNVLSLKGIALVHLGHLGGLASVGEGPVDLDGVLLAVDGDVGEEVDASNLQRRGRRRREGGGKGKGKDEGSRRCGEEDKGAGASFPPPIFAPVKRETHHLGLVVVDLDGVDGVAELGGEASLDLQKKEEKKKGRKRR